MIDFAKPYLYTLDEVKRTLRLAKDSMDVGADELFRVSATDEAKEIFDRSIHKDIAYDLFKKKLTGLGPQDLAYLLNKVFRESAILNFDSLKVVGARETLAEKLNGAFELLALNSLEKQLTPKEYVNGLSDVMLTSLHQTVTSFLGYLIELGEIESVAAIHNYLHLVRLVIDAKNDTNLEGLSSILGGSLARALECHGRLSEVPQEHGAKTVPVSNLLYETFFFRKVIEVLLKDKCYQQPFPREPQTQRALYSASETYVFRAQQKYQELLDRVRAPKPLFLSLGSLNDMNASFSQLSLSSQESVSSKKIKKSKKSKPNSQGRLKSQSFSSVPPLLLSAQTPEKKVNFHREEGASKLKNKKNK